MYRTMRIRFSEAPVAGHVRTQTERDGWCEPAVRYLRRATGRKSHLPRPYQVDMEDQLLFEFAGLEVRIQAHEDHVEVILSDVSGLASRLIRAA